jgi:hypothetical protein
MTGCQDGASQMPRPNAPRLRPVLVESGTPSPAVINVALLYLINVRQGWQAVLFLTEDTSQAEVLSWV